MEKQRNVIAITNDDPEIRSTLTKLLALFGYRTEVYSSAQEFAEAAITTQASCLVIDIQLRDISGAELARHLGATGFRLAIIFMTGSREEAHRQRALDLGCVAYLYKPSVIQLIEAVTDAIGTSAGEIDDDR